MVLERHMSSFGIDLTAAKHVVIYDGLMPPDCKTQFIGRCLRFGQRADEVCVHHLVCKGTVEENRDFGVSSGSDFSLRYCKSILNRLTTE